jgi:hypothetical protein
MHDDTCRPVIPLGLIVRIQHERIQYEPHWAGIDPSRKGRISGRLGRLLELRSAVVWQNRLSTTVHNWRVSMNTIGITVILHR